MPSLSGPIPRELPRFSHAHEDSYPFPRPPPPQIPPYGTTPARGMRMPREATGRAHGAGSNSSSGGGCCGGGVTADATRGAEASGAWTTRVVAIGARRRAIVAPALRRRWA
eukprot:scaffold3886_cov399-Prasinococcus_capsulatus_cf.AAC.6